MTQHEELIRLHEEITLHNARETQHLQLRETARPAWFYPMVSLLPLIAAVVTGGLIGLLAR